MEHASFITVNSHRIFIVERLVPHAKDIVLLCHGFRGSSTGPSRSFVKLAAMLAEKGISSVRFDQYGSGNSEGDFKDSSFLDWIETTKVLADTYIKKGYRVALAGQSMGASNVLVAAAQHKDISCVVAWVPDPSIDEHQTSESGYQEEGGQLVRDGFWTEAHEIHIEKHLTEVTAPCYIISCTNDEYVDEANMHALETHKNSNHTLVTKSGWTHSSWSFAQYEEVLSDSVSFICSHARH
jgi:uncharacterized protein